MRMRETGHAVSRQNRDLLLWTRFHPDARPSRLIETEETSRGATITDLDRAGRSAIHQMRRRFGPGLLTLAWEYDDAPGR